MHPSSSSSPFSSSLENKPPDGALVANVDVDFLGGLRGLEARGKVIVMGFNELMGFEKVLLDAVVSPELCFEGK
jgi:hypothetical protein